MTPQKPWLCLGFYFCIILSPPNQAFIPRRRWYEVSYYYKEPVVGRGQIQYDLLKNTTWSPLATKPLPPLKQC